MWRALLILSVLAVAAAQEPPLQLKDLTAEALKNNREILAAQKRYEAVRQRSRQAGSLPDPTLSLGYNSNGNPLPVAGLGSNPTSNIGLSLTQEFPYPGKRKLRETLAGKDAEAEFEQYQLVELNVIARLKRAYFDLEHSYLEREVLERNRDVLRQLLRVTEVRYSAGRAAQQDIFKTQTQLSVLETKVRRVEQERSKAVAEILSVLNREPGSPLGRPAASEPEELTMPLDELYAHAANDAPRLRREQKLIERSELAVNLARKDFYPDYSITGGYYNQFPMPPMYTFRADVKVPAYFFRKQRSALTEQSQSLAEARHNFEAANQAIHFRIAEEYAAAQTSMDLMKLYTGTIISQAKLALESSLASYETGTIDFLAVLTNYLAIVDFEMNYHEEMHNYHLAVARLEEMTGLALIE